jgi:hypothetical protein
MHVAESDTIGRSLPDYRARWAGLSLLSKVMLALSLLASAGDDHWNPRGQSATPSRRARLAWYVV